MPIDRKQRSRAQIERIRQGTEQRALEQARLVPWKQLADASEQYTDWQVFALWVRAVVEIRGNIPSIVQRELDHRCLGISGRAVRQAEAAVRQMRSPGLAVWQMVCSWADTNAFTAAKRSGWLQAVQHYSSMSIDSMKAWTHWEHQDRELRATPRRALPTLARWKRDVVGVSQLSNPHCAGQQVLDAIRSYRATEWDKLVAGFTELMVFLLWAELAADAKGTCADVLRRELKIKYPGFEPVPNLEGDDSVRCLADLLLAHEIAAADLSRIEAVKFCMYNHPRYPAMVRYASHRGQTQAEDLPGFEEWRMAADSFCEV